MAERGGFEPPVPLLGVHTISSRAPSTARSPLRSRVPSSIRRRWDAAFVHGHPCQQVAGVHFVDPQIKRMPNSRVIAETTILLPGFLETLLSGDRGSFSLPVHSFTVCQSILHWGDTSNFKEIPANYSIVAGYFFGNRTSSQTSSPGCWSYIHFHFPTSIEVLGLKEGKGGTVLAKFFR